MAANLEKYKEAAKKFEQKEQWPKAIEQYVKAIEVFEKSPEDDAELALYNKVGDLFHRVGDSQNAVTYYERAVDRYSEGGLVNNAIALCNKILRIAPGRSIIYLKLGTLFHKKGFGAEAKQNLLEYADRMQKAGQLEECFKALKTFAQLTPGQDELWGVLAQQLRAQAKTPEAAEQVEKLLTEFEARERAAVQRRSRMSRSQITGEELPPEATKKQELVFLDLDEPSPRRSAATATAPPPAAAPPRRPTAPTTRPSAPVARPSAARPPAVELVPPPPEPEIPKLEVESSAIAGAEEAVLSAPPLEIESTALAGAEVEAPSDLPLMEVEPTALAEPEAPAAALPEAPGAMEFGTIDLVEPAAEAPPAEPEAPPAEVEAPVLEELPILEIEEAPAEPVAEVGAPVEPAELVSGLPLLDVGEVEAPVVEAEAEAGALETPIEFLDLGEVETAAPAKEDLEARIAANAEDWEAHRLFGEQLLELGQRERGLQELDAALEGYEQAGELDAAYSIAEEMIRLEPNSVRYNQKRVELAYRQGDRSRLVTAYVELADALLRADEPQKAVAVYQRVLEHDPGNVRARTAIDALLPPTPAPAAAAQPVAAPAAPADEEYVDLGALLLDEEGPKDTRMRIEDEEPTGDEQRDFQEMLAAFKKGVEANVEETDFQSHYDLGIAYKEMGLLDEAIGEFQKALRAPEGRLKASEALGLCFFEKGQFAVAETILKRALEVPVRSDAERIGLLYWLGRTLQDLEKDQEALEAFNRVFAVDINFQDVTERVRALTTGGW
jgi:tetratricopeptide (TPR) repeat protein